VDNDDDDPHERHPVPARVRVMGKLDRTQGQKNRWFRADMHALKKLHEEFGFNTFNLSDAEDSRWDICTDSSDSLEALMKRLVKRNWFEEEDGEFCLSDLGFEKYEMRSYRVSDPSESED